MGENKRACPACPLFFAPRELREFLVEAVFEIVDVTQNNSRRDIPERSVVISASGLLAVGELTTILRVQHSFADGWIKLLLEVRDDLTAVAATL